LGPPDGRKIRPSPPLPPPAAARSRRRRLPMPSHGERAVPRAAPPASGSGTVFCGPRILRAPPTHFLPQPPRGLRLPDAAVSPTILSGWPLCSDLPPAEPARAACVACNPGGAVCRLHKSLPHMPFFITPAAGSRCAPRAPGLHSQHGQDGEVPRRQRPHPLLPAHGVPPESFDGGSRGSCTQKVQPLAAARRCGEPRISKLTCHARAIGGQRRPTRCPQRMHRGERV